MSKPKTTTGRKCSICTHQAVKKINSKIHNAESFRGISLDYGMSDMSVSRHAENCLGLTIAALIQEKKIEQAIDVHEEFREQLAFAKQMREAAREYLSSEIDPLRVVMIPRADETDISYFDFADTNEQGQPKKKTATLHALIAKVEGGLNIEADKITIKHVDIRKFALDAIGTTDACIDKFARISGVYQQDAKNKTDIEKVIHGYRVWEGRFPGAPEAVKSTWIEMLSEASGVKAADIRSGLGIVQEVSEAVQ